MRVGINPAKHDIEISAPRFNHRVIIPVFIPHLEGYFSKSFDVLRLCMTSLLKTKNEHVGVTIVNNGSCENVIHFLQGLLKNGDIDKLVHYHNNMGKINPLLAEIKISQEEFITLSDSDVLFTPGWQDAVEEAFQVFPYLGLISPLPQPDLANYANSFSWLYGIFSRRISRISEHEYDKDSVIQFKRSIGRGSELFPLEKKPFAIKRNGKVYILGAGHFCCTVHRSVVPFLPSATNGLGFQGAEGPAFDYVIERAGFMRLATSQGWVYHMGNVPEKWMYEKLELIEHSNSQTKSGASPEHNHLNNRPFSFPKFLRILIARIFASTRFKPYKYRIAEAISSIK